MKTISKVAWLDINRLLYGPLSTQYRNGATAPEISRRGRAHQLPGGDERCSLQPPRSTPGGQPPRRRRRVPRRRLSPHRLLSPRSAPHNIFNIGRRIRRVKFPLKPYEVTCNITYLLFLRVQTRFSRFDARILPRAYPYFNIVNSNNIIFRARMYVQLNTVLSVI